jgi:hypothetical protein
MKTTIKTIAAICTVVISLTATAQHRSRGNENEKPKHTNNNDNQKIYASANVNTWHPWGGGVSVQIGNYPNYSGNYYYGNQYGYGNYHSMKKAARNSIRNSARVIGQALQFSDWNDIYSPWLAKAIRHQQHARQLYFWGDYAGALNHAERAGYLAWNTLNYFNGYYGYNNGFGGGGYYPNPYSDPNNPYYKKGNTENLNNSSEDDFGYRKKTDSKDSENNLPKTYTERKMQKEEIDNSLPESEMNDKDLLKTSAKDLDIE